MKNALVVAAIIAMLAPTSAWADPCSAVGRIAEALMKRRQDGLSLQSSLDAMKRAASPETQEITEEMVMAAYDVPLYSSPAYKDKAVGEFRDDQQLACMNVVRAAN